MADDLDRLPVLREAVETGTIGWTKALQLAAIACDARVQQPGKPNRATIKPSVRAAVLARDRHRCATPGCRSTHFLEAHHVQPRAQGGSNGAENLVTLCSRCHGLVHDRGATPAPALAPAQSGAR